ncbi:MAG: EVE domain-containing protein [Burkholderiales bacterium]|nr:EVE domain-containing protein [Burkholderiales bacterium]
MKYWLLKSEPLTYGIEHLARDGTTAWTGVRNYQARNFMRDDMKTGDRAFFYHSSCEEPGIVGIVEVRGPARPDETQFDRRDRHYDPAATRDNPRWVCIGVKFVKRTRTVGIPELRSRRELKNLQILKRGNRLSVTPVTRAEWDCIEHLLRQGG